jgi:AraC-like DNA-binding protein
MDGKNGYNSYRVGIPAAFNEVFSHFYFGENRSSEAITQTLLPSFQTILIFCFGTPASLTTSHGDELVIDKCLVLGPIKQAFTYTLPAQSDVMVVTFKDDAFFRLFGTAVISQSEPVHPDRLLDENCFTILWSKLNELTDNHDRIDYILDFCRPYIRERNAVAAQIASFDNPGLSAVKELSEHNDLSERTLQITHKKHFGYSAKEIGRYQRFLKAIELIQANVTSNSFKIDWFEVVELCGYYDQSQLVHDFKYYLNLTPSKYLKFQQGICNARG